MQGGVPIEIMIGFLSTKLTHKWNGHLACGQPDAELDTGTSQIKPPVCKREVQTRTRLRAAIWHTILYFYDPHIITSCVKQYNTKYHMLVLFELKCLMNLPKSLVLLCTWRKSIHFNKRSKLSARGKWHDVSLFTLCSDDIQDMKGKKYLLKTVLF